MLLFNKNCPNCDTYHDATLQECPNCHKSNELYANRDVSTNIVFLHPLAQVGLFIGGFAYAGMLVCGIIWSLFFGGVDNELLRKTLVVFFSYILMFGGLLTIPLVTRRETFLKKFTRPADYAFGAAYAGFVVLAGMVIGMIVSIFHGNETNSNQTAADTMINVYPLIAGFMLILFGPVCEEMTYRVGLYSFLRRINKYLAFAVTCVVFTLIHIDFDATDIVTELWSIPSYLVCGFILTLAYEHRGPACSITAHMLYNLTAFLAILMRK